MGILYRTLAIADAEEGVYWGVGGLEADSAFCYDAFCEVLVLLFF